MKTKIRIGTRGSQLALYQAEKTKEILLEKFPELEVEIVIIHSKGDKILDVALSKIGDKGLFTKELEIALANNKIDIAVHSLKDLPTTLPDGLILGGVLKRGEVRDAFVSKNGVKLKDFTPNMKIATSSLRRKAQLLRYNPDLQIVDIRGNVNTRLRKMSEGHCDAMIMAATGLQRIGLEYHITEIIEPEIILPAVSQGAIAIEMRENDKQTDFFVHSITDEFTFAITTAERIFLRKLEGGCQIPIACYSECSGDDLKMSAFMSFIDGTDIIEHQVAGKLSEANQLAEKLAQYFIDHGAGNVLCRIREVNED